MANMGGAKRIARFLEPLLQNQFWRTQKVGLVWSVPISWGGSKTVFGEGFYGIVSPPLSFPRPFVFL